MLITERFKQTAFATLPALLVLAGTAFAQDAAEATPTLDTGDTAWMLTSTALVLMMTIPGLALFYGGMVRKKNVLSTVMQSFAITCLMSVLWMFFGYSLAFTDGGSMNAYIGGFDKAFLSGVTMESLTGTIPEYLFIVFQMTFAVITPALIAGSFAERMKFSSMLVFMVLWLFIVYVPVAHWVWGGGFLGSDGVLDFAGGTVVHINAGVAGLVAALIIGKRDGYGHVNMAPHNLVLSVIGAALLWVGWFGFNAGSAAGANSLAAVAMLNTQVATAGAALAWMFAEWAIAGKPSVLGIISGAVAGLVAVTPAAGFVNPTGALIIGIIAGLICYVAAVKLKHALGYDDSLDAFGVHGVGGFVGAILTGFFADVAINAAGEGATMGKQFFGAAVTIVYTAVATAIILYVIKAIMGLRPTKQEEMEGLDIALHGESVQ
ncbi:ammonium transporter [Brucella pseudogrignonensis]|uniref:Ammonium transporter n=1 Tax=Brucella pseudogrignonensis TaxID=419475 RepID=A0ABU1MAF9_9HYPH|nr:ammonium transporter [Brucella pseudogrignonensis]MCL7998670.1 ammonium transporter [Brucella sp. 21LCYQ03]MDR6432903.1 Amt family ammonium transporter [Brucella pseudogrignonensis]